MGLRVRRVLRNVLLVIGAVLLAVVAWGLFWLLYNPDVPLAAPVVLQRGGGPLEVTVVLAGDFAPTDAAMPVLRTHGYRYPYRPTAEFLRSADVAFANLEAPVTENEEPFPLYKKYIYKVAPEAVDAWQWLGLDLVNLANNHLGDYRDRGVRDTLRFLDAAGIAHVGGGTDETEARRPVIVDVGGTRIGFLGYLEDRIGYNLYLRAYAVGRRTGSARFVRSDVEQDVRRLRPLVDVLIVSVHWGDNYADVTDDQEEDGRWLADLGVDVVAGHHAHDVQSLEWRGRCLILYSLGNYAWGTPGYPHLRVGLLARLRLARRTADARGRVAGVELLPIVTQNAIVRFQPRPVREHEREWLEPFLTATRARGTEPVWEGNLLRVPVPAETEVRPP